VRDVDVHCRLLASDCRPDFLSPSERERASKFRRERDRHTFIARRVLLREILSRYAGADPAAIEFVRSEFGKPRVKGAELHFSASHSSGLALIAVSRTREIGVDVERIDPAFDREGVARHFFCGGEIGAAAGSVEEFFRIWTRKEAYVKAIGVGFSVAPESFDLSVDPSGWSLESFSPAPGYIATLAAKTP
jgi:4'-phosphopantetheinyl transferase